MKNRQVRLADRERIRKRHLREMYWVVENSVNEKIMIDTPVRCSCFMCGNPRRHYGEITIQEQRIRLEEKDELEEILGV
jgi:hypothetical protein